jgi:hypothetical protein
VVYMKTQSGATLQTPTKDRPKSKCIDIQQKSTHTPNTYFCTFIGLMTTTPTYFALSGLFFLVLASLKYILDRSPKYIPPQNQNIYPS